jgi:alkanesulfonate monooxygenase SsuD/methylene tetrahydromethanopterin reductase-like flavin-dependent oxidoreductase (luciferase family)
MKFSIQLSADYPDKSYGADRVYGDMIEQAVLADRLRYDAVGLTEHHLINCLMNPAPLQFAVKIAAHTDHVKIMTSVLVLPLHDMRILAGELVVADVFTEGRLLAGVGRGAFKYEMERLGVPMEETRERFDESLAVLQSLLTHEEVSWKGKFYDFEPLTVMPRPVSPGRPSLMMAVMNPAGIVACTKRGFHIQTTALSGDHQMLVDQVAAHKRAKEALGADGERLSISLSRVGFVADNEADRTKRVEAAHRYYGRFDNVFTGPGIVDAGMIRQLPREQHIDDLAKSLLVCTTEEMIERLSVYADLGVDRVILNVNFGLSQGDTLETIERFATEVAPFV